MFTKKYLIILFFVASISVVFFSIFSSKIEAKIPYLGWPDSGVEIKAGSRYEYMMDVVADSLGNSYYLVEDTDPDFTDYDLYIYKVNSSGEHLWIGGKELGVHADGVSDEEMISDGDDGLIISWESGDDPNSTALIQRIDKNGNFIWGGGQSDPLVVGTGLIHPEITAVSDGSGGAFISWTDDATFTAYAQHIDASGNKLWGASGVSVTSTLKVGLTQITADQSGGIILVLSRPEAEQPTGVDLFAQRLDSTGAKLWGDDGKVVVDVNFDQTEPQIVTDGANGAYIAWTDYRIGGSEMESNVYLHRLNANGDAYGGNWVADGITTITANGISEEKPRMLPSDLEFGGVYLTWNEDNAGLSNIKFQYINNAGIKKSGNSGGIVCNATGAQNNPEFALSTNGVVIAWEDNRSGSVEIYSQLLTDLGSTPPTLNWPINGGTGINLTPSSPDNPNFLNVAALPSGGLVAAWTNYRTDGCCSNYDVFAGKIDYKYQINLSSSAYLDTYDSEGNSVKYVYQGTNGLTGQDHPIKLTDGKGRLIADISKVDFLSDLVWYSVRARSYKEAGIAYVKGLYNVNLAGPSINAPGIDGTYDLYVPKFVDSTAVVLCHTFSGIDTINMNCPDKEFRNANSPGVSVVTIEGQTYWKISGLSSDIAAMNYPVSETNSCFYTLSYYDDQIRVLDALSGVTKSSRSLSYTGTVDYAAGLAQDPISQEYYAILYLDGDDYPSLTKVDIDTGVVTVITAMDDYFSSLTFDAAGNLFGTVDSWADTPYKLYSINKTTGAQTAVADLGSAGDGGEVLAFNSDDGLIYHLSGSTEYGFEKVTSDTYARTSISLSGDSFDTPLGLYYWEDAEKFIFSDYYTDSFYHLTTSGAVTQITFNDEEGHVGFTYKGACNDAPLPSEIPLSATTNQLDKIDLVMNIPSETYTSVVLRKKTGECSSTNLFADHTDGAEIYSPTSPTPGQQISFSDTDVSGTTKYCYAVFGQNVNGWNDLALFGSTTNYASGWLAIDAESPPTDPTDENGNEPGNNIENSSTTTPPTPTSYPISYSMDREDEEPLDENTDDDLVTFETTSTGVVDNDKEGKDQIVTVENVLKLFTYILLASTATASVLSTSTALSTVSVALIPKAVPFLIWKKHQNPWGVVRDSLTKEPIAYVSVKAFNGVGKVVGSTMTDLEGQYAFKSGLNLARLEFHHHSYNKMKKEINLAGAIEKGMLDIEMNSKSNNSLDSKTLDTLDARRGLVSITKKLFIIGFVVTIITTVIYPVTINLIITGFYFVFAALYVIRSSRKSRF
jgi:hypothetical protein